MPTDSGVAVGRPCAWAIAVAHRVAILTMMIEMGFDVIRFSSSRSKSHSQRKRRRGAQRTQREAKREKRSIVQRLRAVPAHTDCCWCLRTVESGFLCAPLRLCVGFSVLKV